MSDLNWPDDGDVSVSASSDDESHGGRSPVVQGRRTWSVVVRLQ